MIRNLKILGLAMGALLAFGAVAASSASAQHPENQGLLTSDGPVTLTGEDTGVGQNWFKAFGNTVECPNSTYTGHAVKNHEQTTQTEKETGKKHELLPNGSTEVTVTPHYKQVKAGPTANCDVNGGEFSATVQMNGCDYEFYDFTTVAASTYSFLADLVCPAGVAGVVVRVYSGHGHVFEVCKLTVPPQEGLTGFKAKHTAGEADDVDLEGLSKNVKVTESGLCGHKETAEAEYNLDVTVKGHNAAGGNTPVTITDATS